MDACTYESITGLKNYEGFKSQLKNSSSIGPRFNISDETIVFNSVFCVSTQGIGVINLDLNQVAVILNAPFAASRINNVVAVNTDDYWFATDTEGYNINFMGEGAQGLIVQTSIGTTALALSYVCQFAIFDLY